VKISEVRKFVVAAAAGLGILGTALVDGAVSSSEWVAVALAFLAALGVYRVPNEQRKTDV
jgi:hypothetical protein